MPTYDYLCDVCKQKFEIFQSIHAEALRCCPNCNEQGLQRLISPGAGIIFKGSGYYVNDSRQSPPAANSAASGAAQSKDDNSATAGDKAATSTKSSDTSTTASEQKKSAAAK